MIAAGQTPSRSGYATGGSQPKPSVSQTQEAPSPMARQGLSTDQTFPKTTMTGTSPALPGALKL